VPPGSRKPWQPSLRHVRLPAPGLAFRAVPVCCLRIPVAGLAVYVGTRVGCPGCGCLTVILGAVAVTGLVSGALSLILLPWTWPLLAFGGGHDGWLAEFSWLGFLAFMFVYVLGGHRARKEAKAARQSPAPGPRDWNQPDDTLEL
jgi:hypothetical protein